MSATNTVRVHIVLKVSADLDNAKNTIVDETGMHDVNEARLHRYGILTGTVDPGAIPVIESFSFVASVSRDKERKAL